MKTTVRFAAALAALTAVGLLAGPAQAAKKVDTAKAYKKTGWGDNVTVTIDKDARTIRYRSDGLPNHELLPEYAVPNPGVMFPTERDILERLRPLAVPVTLAAGETAKVELPVSR